MLSSPMPVESEFMGCYLGTADPSQTTNMTNVYIDKMITAPCNFYYDYPTSKYTPMNMSISLSCGSNYDTDFRIIAAKLCSKVYSLMYQTKLVWNYRNDNCYECLSLNIYSSNAGSPSYMTGKNNTDFEKVWNTIMTNGTCPPPK